MEDKLRYQSIYVIESKKILNGYSFFRIANKVNKKYLELLEELDNNVKEAMTELGNEETQNILTNQNRKQVSILKREGKEFFSKRP